MSLNKGKAKVKAKSKSIAKGAGKNKAAVMNSRSPKKPMAISGDTMSNYAMYKKGGKVKKYQPGGRTAAPPIDDSMTGSPAYTRYSGPVNYSSARSNPGVGSSGGADVTRFGPDKYTFMENNPRSNWFRGEGAGGKKYTINQIRALQKAMDEGDTQGADAYAKSIQYMNVPEDYEYRKKGGTIKRKKYKAGGTTKAKKFAALAPPYNKITAADRIAGAKKNARKK